MKQKRFKEMADQNECYATMCAFLQNEARKGETVRLKHHVKCEINKRKKPAENYSNNSAKVKYYFSCG